MDIQEKKDEKSIWENFVINRSLVGRDVLIAKYKPYANMLAAMLYANRHIKEIEFDDFRQYAIIGLIEAIDRFNPTYDTNFKSYASHRIKGSILNGIEKYCERQQQISALSRIREERMKSLLLEVSESKDKPFDKLVNIAIGVAIGYMLEDSGMYQSGEEHYVQNIYHGRELRDLVRVMSEIVSTLDEQEQYVIKYHYYEHLPFNEIAQLMQLSKGRISQVHHNALRRMHSHYDQLKLLRLDY